MVAGSNPGQGDGFLRVITIRSTTSFGREVKPEVPCRKILRHVKELLKSHRDERLNSHFLRPSLTRCRDVSGDGQSALVVKLADLVHSLVHIAISGG
jgi:hypothetical protein